MSAKDKKYPIYVKTLAGSNKEVNVQATDTVKELKKTIESTLESTVIKLLFRNKELADETKTLEELKIEQESIIVAIIEKEKPSHFFFALDESGSMSGGRWNALMESFVEFIDTRQKRIEAAEKDDVGVQDVVSVFFHETHCRFANCKLSDGKVVPFDSIPLVSLKPDSLVNDFRSGGNNFDHALTYMEPHLKKATAYIPVLLFMTDGGDCGDNDARPGDFRQRAYDHMANLKKEIPDLRVYVTVVFTKYDVDIEGAKKLCLAAGMDLSTNYNYIEDDGSANSSSLYPPPFAPSPLGYGLPGSAPSPVAYSAGSLHSSVTYSEGSFSSSSVGYGPGSFPPSPLSPLPLASASSFSPSLSVHPSPSAPPSHYSSVSISSAQRQMAAHWDNVYSSNSYQK